MFQAWEEWDFVTATYFSFITLTTVGFGDYTPDNSMKNALKKGAIFSDWVQMILCLIYLMFGKCDCSYIWRQDFISVYTLHPSRTQVWRP